MIKLTNNIDEATFVTHAGNFHADDVFSTMFLEKIFENIILIRLNDYKDDKTKLAYDIGLGKFDHHGHDFDKKRKNGIHYCSFGLLWQEYGLDYLKKIKVEYPEKTFKVLDELLVTGIDAFDNGEYSIDAPFNIYSLSTLIELFRPKFGQNENENDCFLKAVSFADIIFNQVLNDAISKVSVITKIEKLSKNIKEKVLVLNEYIPYEYAIFKLGLDVEFVIYPSNRGGYAVHTVPIKYKSFISKVPLKKEWGGLHDEQLQKISGIKTARFCHKNLFLATADTLEDAKRFVDETRKNQ